MSPAPPPGYDDVRRRLVERGYLQGRVERFLLKDLVAEEVILDAFAPQEGGFHVMTYTVEGQLCFPYVSINVE